MSEQNGHGGHTLRGRAKVLGTRPSTDRLDRALLVAGCVLVPLGITLILLGWLGTSQTPLVFEQIPYLVSGGLLGLALVVAGGFAYFGYWQSVRVREARDQHEELLAEVRRLTGPPSASVGREPEGLVMTEHGTMVHRPDCPVVRDRTGLRVVTDDAGLELCGICTPQATFSG
jgi:hypothetical protein